MVAMFRLHTRLFVNTIEEMTEEQATNQLTEDNNHAAWMAGHLLSTRYMMVNLMGGRESEPNPELFEQGKGIIPEADYPDLATIKSNWMAISEKMVAKLESLTEEQLSEESPLPTPIGGKEMRDTIAFFCHHEAYHIGQLGFLRKSLGLDAMKYN